LRTGFIQANTKAPLASGGRVNIDVATLLVHGGSLTVGGNAIQTFQSGQFGNNVIQAAAPDGVSGVVQLANPQIDLSGSLASLNANLIDYSSLLTTDCQTTGNTSLVVKPHGGLPLSSKDPYRPEL
jgi:large exoprotein involved in heme utilization and adhesion